MIKTKLTGRAVFGSPDLIIEILSPSTSKRVAKVFAALDEYDDE